jgi:predicted enzyme related to lactoylglutathione lyase
MRHTAPRYGLAMFQYTLAPPDAFPIVASVATRSKSSVSPSSVPNAVVASPVKSKRLAVTICPVPEGTMRLVNAGVAACVLAATTVAMAQESGIRVRSIRVLATDPVAIAAFYEKAFGMSETKRPVETPTFVEIVINSGSTAEQARKATTTPIVIATRPDGAPSGAMAALILQVPNLDEVIAAVQANGGTLGRPAAATGNLSFGFVKDPDGNQIELIMTQG